MEWATKKDFDEAKVPRETVTLWNGKAAYVYGLTCQQKDDYENFVISLSGGNREVKLTNARANLLILTVHNQQGKPLFTNADIGKISTYPVAYIEPVLDVARRLSGMGSAEIKQLVKNSGTAPSEGSGSG